MKTLKENAFLIVVVLMMAIGAVWLAVMVPMFRISTGSMEPTLPVGSIVFLGPADELAEGDIIAFRQEGDASPTAHTFVGYAEDGSLMTMGDANPTPDVYAVPLTHDAVIGKVVIMTPLLAPSFWLSQRGLLIVGFGLASAMFFWWASQPDKKKEELQSEEKELATTS